MNKPDATIYPGSEYQMRIRSYSNPDRVSISNGSIEILMPHDVAEIAGAELFERSTGISPYELMGILMITDNPQLQAVKDRITQFRNSEKLQQEKQ